MNEAEYKQLLELSWRQKLSADDEIRLQSYLAEHPEAQVEAEADASLNQLLWQVSDVPIPSNFTARVMQAVERETAAPAPSWLLRWFQSWPIVFTPRAGWVALALALLLIAQQQYQFAARHRMAEGLAILSRATTLPGPQLMEDFDAIQGLSQLPPVMDEELWAALSQ